MKCLATVFSQYSTCYWNSLILSASNESARREFIASNVAPPSALTISSDRGVATVKISRVISISFSVYDVCDVRDLQMDLSEGVGRVRRRMAAIPPTRLRHHAKSRCIEWDYYQQ